MSESPQRACNITPLQHHRDSPNPAQRKKRKRRSRKLSSVEILRDTWELEDKIAPRMDADMDDSIDRLLTQNEERYLQEREWHEKRFAELCKNLNVKGSLEGIS